MENSVVICKCGFGYNTIVNECNFYLKSNCEDKHLLASYVNGVLEVFDNVVDCNIYDESQSNWDCNDFLRTYLCKDTKIVFADLEPNGNLHYLAVEATFNQARQILENFLDCYGEMIITIENNFD